MIQIKSIKREIISLIEMNETSKVLEKLNQYEELLEKDLEVYTIKAAYYHLIGEIHEGIKILKEGLKKNKLNYELNYNLGILYEQIGEDIKAFKYYIISEEVSGDQAKKDEVNACKERLLYKMLYSVKDQQDKKNKLYNQIQQAINEVDSYLVGGMNRFPKKSASESYIGRFYKEQFFVGKYDYWSERVCKTDLDLAHHTVYKVEMYQAQLTDRMEVEEKEDYIIPIASKNAEHMITIKESENEYIISPKEVDMYYYYSIKGPATLYSNTPFICGNPIKKVKNTKNKELVLNIFIDGLSQYVIENMGIQNIMPNTYRFFSKGTICNNAYSSGEWTYVSMASFFTGKYTTHHKMFHPRYIATLPDDQKVLPEIFKQHEYFTSKIYGCWRSSPVYGYERGMDRIVYQPAFVGMNLEEIIMELIEHIETFRDKNQFIWTCINELHDVADGFESRLLVQSKMDIRNRKFNNKPKAKSVHIKYDEDKIERYKLQIKRIDTYLGLLFSYLEANFEDQNIVVSLVSDHGQSYLLNEGEPLLCNKRTKVPMMFRGGGVPKGECNELVQGLDLMSILCKVCEIPIEEMMLDFNLPIHFGGERQREYTYSESIYPDATYKAAIHMENQTLFYETIDKVKNDGRVSMDEYTLLLVDKEGNEKEIDEQFKQEMLEIINNHMAYNRIY